MIEALRGLGYAAPTAIADIIDNSISAGADEVNIDFTWRGPESAIVISDNGRGMDANELEFAMRLGERSPLEVRDKHDLGRFGLGLKTASFSQCRRLTVVSRKGDEANALTWDLDVLQNDPSGDWKLLEGMPAGCEALAPDLADVTAGTWVIWQAMDRITPAGATEQEFLDAIDGIERHLSMVFHRYIERRKVRILINGRAIPAWDPFLESRSETWRSGSDSFTSNGHLVTVEGYVLPHQDKLEPRIWRDAAGPDGWTSQQGFYVYRNERMLVAGSWLGLGRNRSWTKEEAFRLARIRLDLPNSADLDWKIDIRKSIARPPPAARRRLTLLAETVREKARRVFAYRGSPATRNKAGAIASVWRSEHKASGVRYRIDASHPYVSSILEQAGALRPELEALFRIVEETVPVQQIWLDTAEASETPRTKFEAEPAPEVLAVMRTVFRNMVKHKGVTEEEARLRLSRMEPFDSYPDFVASLALPTGET